MTARPLRVLSFALSGLLAVACHLAVAQPAPNAADQQPPAPSNWPSILRRDLYPQWINANGQVHWPPNDGCQSQPQPVTIQAGTEIDRFGSENGRFFSQPGQTFAARAMPYVCKDMPYTVYKVTRPLPVQACKAAPWFGAPGGAVQYQTDDPAFKLRESGTIVVVPRDTSGHAATPSPCEGP